MRRHTIRVITKPHRGAPFGKTSMTDMTSILKKIRALWARAADSATASAALAGLPASAKPAALIEA